MVDLLDHDRAIEVEPSDRGRAERRSAIATSAPPVYAAARSPAHSARGTPCRRMPVADISRVVDMSARRIGHRTGAPSGKQRRTGGCIADGRGGHVPAASAFRRVNRRGRENMAGFLGYRRGDEYSNLTPPRRVGYFPHRCASRRMSSTEVCHRMSMWIILTSAPERPCADPVGALCGRSVPSSA